MGKKEPTFSIITPTRDRDGRYEKGMLMRCIRSVAHQTYPKKLYEHIIVDDGNAVDSVNEHGGVSGLYGFTGVKYQIVRHEKPTERYVSYNDGMKAAGNDWIVFLDDDDEYVTFYLEYLAHEIKENPKIKVFNYGGLVCHKRDRWVRARAVVPFEQKVGAKVESGQIVNGQFAFKRTCLKKSGYLPNTQNLWDGYDMADIPGYGSGVDQKPLGNPWGQDFILFYYLTRHYISKPLPYYLYICHLRGTE
jgi:glycosyltransferase involved in cell wall biosynthesis